MRLKLVVALSLGLICTPLIAQTVGNSGPPQVNGAAPLPSANIYVGNASGIATAAGLNGDCTMTNTAAITCTKTNGTAFGTIVSQNYTEGTWTPTITTDGTVGTPAYSVQVGSYERIGRLVTARFYITLSGWTGSPTGNVYLGGLPVTSSAVANSYGSCTISSFTVAGLAASTYGMVGLVAVNNTLASLYSNGNAGTNVVTAAQFGTTGTIIGTCMYRT